MASRDGAGRMPKDCSNTGMHNHYVCSPHLEHCHNQSCQYRMQSRLGHRFSLKGSLVAEGIHTQQAKRKEGTSLMGWRTGQRMGQRMLEAKTSMLREMVEAKMVRGICSRKWA